MQRNTATQSLSGDTEATKILEPFSAGAGRNASARPFIGRRVDDTVSNESKAHEPFVTMAANESETLTDVIGKELMG